MSTVVSTDKTRPYRVLSSKKCKSFFSLLFLNIINIRGIYTKLTILPLILTLDYSKSLILDIYKVKHIKHQL